MLFQLLYLFNYCHFLSIVSIIKIFYVLLVSAIIALFKVKTCHIVLGVHYLSLDVHNIG